MWKAAYNLTRSPQPPTTPRIRNNMRNRWRVTADRRASQGLTTRGTVPKRRIEQRLLLADVDALAGALKQSFESLPPAAQAVSIRLVEKLSAVRRKLL